MLMRYVFQNAPCALFKCFFLPFWNVCMFFFQLVIHAFSIQTMQLKLLNSWTKKTNWTISCIELTFEIDRFLGQI